jgi:hypothetical protein
LATAALSAKNETAYIDYFQATLWFYTEIQTKDAKR